MALIKVSNLFGPALDWAVAKCAGVKIDRFPEAPRSLFYGFGFDKYKPSSDWSLAGPIIERENISVIRCDDESIPNADGLWCGKYEPRWAAVAGDRHSTENNYESNGESWGLCYKVTSSAVIGPTPLVAAMRCYVASRLGATVDIPDELLRE